MKPLDFDTALDECLACLQAGENLEACLGRFPNYAEDLRPLLWAAARARSLPVLPPSAEGMERGRERVRAASARKPQGGLAFWGFVPLIERAWANRPRRWRALVGQGVRWVASPASVLVLAGLFVGLMWLQMNRSQPELSKPTTVTPTAIATSTPCFDGPCEGPTFTKTPSPISATPCLDGSCGAPTSTNTPGSISATPCLDGSCGAPTSTNTPSPIPTTPCPDGPCGAPTSTNTPTSSQIPTVTPTANPPPTPTPTPFLTPCSDGC